MPLMSTLGTGHHAEYSRLPISLALLLFFLLLWPHHVEEELINLLELVAKPAAAAIS